MKKTKKLTLFILFSFVSLVYYGTAFALEVKWPIIPGIPEITSVSTIADFTVYSYAFIVYIGSFIAVLVLISAGIDFLTSHDIPKIKTKIAGAIIGLFVLLIPYSLLTILNPDILNPQEKKLSCAKSKVCVVTEMKTKITSTTTGEDGKVTKKETEETKTLEESNIQSTPKIDEKDTATLNNGKTIREMEKEKVISIMKYDGLQNVIAYSEENYKGTATMLFADDPANDNINTPLKVIITISGKDYKSFEIVPKADGAYLYDAQAYGASPKAPFFTQIGTGNLNRVVNSIDIVTPEKGKGITYVGLLFNKNNYRTKCGVFYEDVPDVGGNELLADAMPSANEGSIKVYKRNKNSLVGSKIILTLYNNTSCSSRETYETTDKKDTEWDEIRKCEITLLENDADIPSVIPEELNVTATCDEDDYTCRTTLKSVDTIVFPVKIIKACPNFATSKTGSGEDVLSFRIDSTSTVVFLDSYEMCNAWDLLRISRDKGDCNQVNMGGMNPESSFRPKKFYVIPY